MYRKVIGIALGIVAAAPASAAVDEILVTAQRREQNLQDVGLAVTAFSAQDVRNQGFASSVDITHMTPNLNYTVPQGEGSQLNFFLRGVGLNDFADAQENPVAVYVDDVYKPAMGGLAMQLFDVERIEVLRGPQGALFGRNSTGGVIHFVTRRPGAEFESYVDAGFGDFDRHQLEAVISGQLVEGLSARASLGYDEHDGWTRNRVAGVQDYNGGDSVATRLQLLFQPSEQVDILLAGNYSDSKASVGAWQHQATKPSDDGNVSLPLAPNEDFWGSCPGCDAFGYSDVDGNPWAGDYDRPGRVESENQGVQANVDVRVGGITITSITAFGQVERLQQEDTDMNPFLGPDQSLSFIAPTFAATTDTFSQELRVAGESERMRWLAGVYRFANDVNGAYDLNTDAIGFVAMDADYLQETDSTDIFGQVEFDLGDSWTLIAGLRWTDEEKELDFENIDFSGITAFCSTEPDPQAEGCFNPEPTQIDSWRPTPDHMILFNRASVGDLAVHDDSYTTGRLQLNWRAGEDLLFYGSYSRGKKSAGFNNGFLDTTQIFGNNPLESIPFDAETLDAFEVGAKSTILGGTTRLNAAAFYYDYQDFQTFQWLILNQVIFNADAEVYGGEIEIDSRPIDGLTLQAGLGWLNATAEDIPTIQGDAVQDRHMVGAPEISLNGLVRYEWQVLDGLTMAVQGSTSYQNEIWYDIQNHPISREDGYWLVNARASLAREGRWEIYAYADNVFDEAYKTYTFDFSGLFGFNQQAFGPPRWWGVGARFEFGAEE
ncbi:MAG: TonB-dependent receptor [Gammaproteobacteria bacterium]|nr:TonB-dependent receptor [Gammaproteobacteria bacterium]